ncbi:uncharacterized protein DNG_08171 [Cephalotrichum gorgonifer]|uniref:Uncharacterized protein n=1 Tax=Cephalotrichum gorgonifer TaxID=2041049 RepID=A0AAE8N4N8_9PEZI|nr:uncharacterized protein DNG_08171 [Cephalotrichum gorgonifer]
MSSLLCCASTEAYRPQYLQHQAKFTAFMDWAQFPKACATKDGGGQETDLEALGTPYIVQLVRQVNYGPLESKRYFASVKGTSDFIEVTEDDLIRANFQKLNSYKNYRCGVHNKFFEVNLYQKDPVNKHHWRVNVARPGSQIDL